MARFPMILVGFFCVLTSLGQDDGDEAHRKLAFLVGSWRTESLWPENGEKATGRLDYEWVLGGAWLKITFVGQHPRRPVWEAHGMLRFQPEKGSYEALIFAGPGEPMRMRGFWVSAHTLRLEMTGNGRRTGIDYTPMDQGVYQENWRQTDDGGHEIRLKTTYERESD